MWRLVCSENFYARRQSQLLSSRSFWRAVSSLIPRRLLACPWACAPHLSWSCGIWPDSARTLQKHQLSLPLLGSVCRREEFHICLAYSKLLEFSQHNVNVVWIFSFPKGKSTKDVKGFITYSCQRHRSATFWNFSVQPCCNFALVPLSFECSSTPPL